MIIVEHGRIGFMISFGFNPATRLPDKQYIFWSRNGNWEAKAENDSGSVRVDFDLAPEFVRETHNGIMAYQPGQCVEMEFIGLPLVFMVKVLLPTANLLPLP